jgi:hypothetical protein
MQDHDLYGVQLRSTELTRLFLLSLALIQVAITVATMIAPITHTIDEDQDPLSAPGLFLALTRVRKPGDAGEDQTFGLIVSAVVVVALLASAVVALLLAGAVDFPGKLPTIQFVLAAVVVIGTLALLPAVNSLSLEYLGNDHYAFDSDHSAGGPAWGLWLPIAAAVWAVHLARGVKRLSDH